jgi:hypothetical protein
MDIQQRRKLIFKSTYYLTTLICLGLLVWAMVYAFKNLNIPSILALVICILVAIYLVYAIKASRKRWGFEKFVTHTLALQLAPLCVALLALNLIPEQSATAPALNDIAEEEIVLGPYEPLTGRPRDFECSFNDLQDKQKEAALKNGLAPFESRAVIEANYNRLHKEGKLVHIKSNSKYIVRDLTYSSPYVVPKVAKLLNDIALAFIQKTQSRSRFIVTSVLRTEEDIEKLREVNGNASSNSCHCNATTIDISYASFEQDEERPRDLYELRLALAQVLHQLRKEERCYVKIERKQFCYHITVR